MDKLVLAVTDIVGETVAVTELLEDGVKTSEALGECERLKELVGVFDKDGVTVEECVSASHKPRVPEAEIVGETEIETLTVEEALTPAKELVGVFDMEVD